MSRDDVITVTREELKEIEASGELVPIILTLDDLVEMLEKRGQRLTFAVMLHLPGGAGVIDVTRNLMAGGFEFTFGVSEPEKAGECVQ